MLLTWRGHGGQGPGWHSSTQEWPQSGARRRSQVRPQVCGSSQASKGGSACCPHMQRYSRGASPAGYSALHLGHAHTAAPAAGALAGSTGPCDLHMESTA